MTYIPIRQGHIARLSCGSPAYTRGGFVTETMIRQHGSYAAARQVVAQRQEAENDR